MVGRHKDHPTCKNRVMSWWRGHLSGARCKWFAYGPADATATTSSLASLKSRLIINLSGADLSRLTWKRGFTGVWRRMTGICRQKLNSCHAFNDVHFSSFTCHVFWLNDSVRTCHFLTLLQNRRIPSITRRRRDVERIYERRPKPLCPLHLITSQYYFC